MVWVFILCLLSPTAQETRRRFENIYQGGVGLKFIKIMNYNTYFLYDTEDDPDVALDQKFIPRDYPLRLKSLAELINRLSPDVLGLQEIENRKVLEDLSRYLKKDYSIFHFESRDKYLGQDLALLVNRAVLKPRGPLRTNLETSASLVDRKGRVLVEDLRLAKGILEVELEILSTGESLVFLVVHLKSQIGGFGADLKRIAQAHVVRKRMDQILKKNKKIFLLGDLNDINPSPVIKMITGESAYSYGYDGSSQTLFYDLFVDYDRRFNYTFKHQKYLKAGGRYRYLGTFHSRLDFIFASPKVLGRCREAQIDQSYALPSGISKSSEIRNLQGGIGLEAFDPARLTSDHYPVLVNYYLDN
jgi:endonuclease/exonuclease/phosphatase family metal-dependent hydrolase